MAVKKGLAGGGVLLTELNADWWYGWRDNDVGSPTRNIPSQVDDSKCVPALMGQGLYDPDLHRTGETPAQYDNYILFLSEPDSLTDPNVSAEDAADLYYAHYNTNYTAVRSGDTYSSEKFVVGGLVTLGDDSGQPPEERDPYVWVEDFIARCNSQGYDLPSIWAFHTYGIWYDRKNADDRSFVDQFESLCSLQELVSTPIWITEMGYQTARNHSNFFHKQLRWMDSIDWIERYAAFPGYGVMDIPGYWPGYNNRGDSSISVNSADNSFNSSLGVFDDSPAIVAGFGIWVQGFTNEENNGFFWVKTATSSKLVVEGPDGEQNTLTTESAGNTIFLGVNMWYVDMRLWDGTDDVITDAGQTFKDFTEDEQMIHLLTEPEIVVTDGDYATDFDWTELDLSSVVPVNTRGVYVRLTAKCNSDHPSGYISFGGEGDLASTGLTLRAESASGRWREAQGLVKTNNSDPQSIYWKVNIDNIWSDVYVVIIGYVL